MKKLLFFSQLLIFSFSKAQQYHPLLDSVNEWNYFSICMAVSSISNPCFYGSVHSYYFSEFTSNDTIINSMEYKRVNSDIACLMGYIREDTLQKKVYFIDNQFNPEILLYDFSLQAGDSINLSFPITSDIHNPGYYHIDSIISVNLFGGTRNALYLNPTTGGNQLIWIEGVGCTEALLYPYAGTFSAFFFPTCPEIQHQSSQFLICFKHENKIYFDDCAYNVALSPGYILNDSCSFTNYCSGISNFEKTDLNISPNPAMNYITVTTDHLSVKNYHLTLMNINGQKIKTWDHSIIVEGKKIVLEINDISSGVYILECNYDDNLLRKKIVVTKN
jgi:hypothetical protein